MSCFVVVLTTLIVWFLILRPLNRRSENSGMATVIEIEELA